MAERIVYQFPVSHYCEKTRWHLDAKGLSYRVKNLAPGVSRLVVRRASGTGTVPVLVDGGREIGDSVTIAAHLERAYPAHPLLPADVAARGQALELEAYFAGRPGHAVRQWLYGQLAERPGAITEVFARTYPLGMRVALRLAAPLLEAAIRRSYRLYPEQIRKARLRIDEALERVEQATGGDPSRYLAGDALSVADITAAALLGPLVAAPESPWAPAVNRMPEHIQEVRELLAQRPGWAWVVARYREDRARVVPG